MAVQIDNSSPVAVESDVRSFRPPALLPYAVGLVAGILFERFVVVQTSLALGAMALLVAGLWLRWVRSHVLWIVVFLIAACSGAVLHHRAFRTVAVDDIVQFTLPEQRLARVTGTIIDRPHTRSAGYEPFEPWLFQQSRTSFLIAVDGIESPDGSVNASGKLRVTVKEAALHVRAGARVEVFGWLYRPLPPRNPGGFDWALFQIRQGIRAHMSCKRAECVRVLESPESDRWWSAGRLRLAVRRLLLDERLEQGGDEVAVLDAMVLGRRAGVDRKVERAFVDSGCAHYLAVSGMHVGMLALAVWIPARLLGFAKRRAVWIVVVVVVAYALLVDPRPPIMRSAFMAVAYGFAVALRRPRAATSAVCLAAIVMLAVDPLALFDVGFQLSFVTVLGILAFTPVVSEGVLAGARRAIALLRREKKVSADIERIAEQHAEYRKLRRIAKVPLLWLAVAVAAWLCALPIVASVFGRVPLWGWFNSWLSFSLVFVVMVLGFLRIAVGAVLPPAGLVLDAPLDVAVGLLLRVLDALAHLPAGNLSVSPLPWWLVLLYYLALLAIAARVRGVLPRGLAPLAVLALVVGAGFGWGSSDRPDGVRITQLAVGRGTATVIELPDGGVWLYDAGASGSYDPGANVIVPYLHHRGIRSVDGIIISHANLDHFGGVPSIIDAIACGPVYVSTLFAETCTEDSPCAKLMDVLRKRHHPVRSAVLDEDWQISNSTALEVLWPPPDPPVGIDVNDTSLVIRLRYGQTSVLFCGDIGFVPQQWLIDNRDISADVLVLPHHGAVESNSAAFIGHVGADVVVRSSFNSMDESDELYNACAGRTIFNTADDGAIEILLDGAGFSVSGFTSPAGSVRQYP